ncbi:YncE family protein [Cellulomonas sp. C5510]|nr:YncE family protein [Cellulomonas sp. C5510]
MSNTSQNTISEIDPVSLEEARRIEVGHGPRGLGIVPGDTYLLVSNSGSDSLSIVDLALNVEVRQIGTGRDPRHMAITPDGRWAFVCIWGDGVIAKIDLAGLATGRVEDVAIVETFDVGSTAHPYAPALDPSGSRLFVANTQATYLSVIDIHSGVVTQIELGSIGGRAITFTTDGRYALATIEARSEVVVIDLTTLEETRRIPAGPRPAPPPGTRRTGGRDPRCDGAARVRVGIAAREAPHGPDGSPRRSHAARPALPVRQARAVPGGVPSLGPGPGARLDHQGPVDRHRLARPRPAGRRRGRSERDRPPGRDVRVLEPQRWLHHSAAFSVAPSAPVPGFLRRVGSGVPSERGRFRGVAPRLLRRHPGRVLPADAVDRGTRDRRPAGRADSATATTQHRRRRHLAGISSDR